MNNIFPRGKKMRWWKCSEAFNLPDPCIVLVWIFVKIVSKKGRKEFASSFKDESQHVKDGFTMHVLNSAWLPVYHISWTFHLIPNRLRYLMWMDWSLEKQLQYQFTNFHAQQTDIAARQSGVWYDCDTILIHNVDKDLNILDKFTTKKELF